MPGLQAGDGSWRLSRSLLRLGIAMLALDSFAGWAVLAPERMRADVSMSADCVPVGTYRFYNSRGGLQTSGQYESGQRTGVWTFWDSRGVKVVELTYVRGAKEGACHMWYGSFAYPSAAESKKLDAHFSLDRQDGRVTPLPSRRPCFT